LYPENDHCINKLDISKFYVISVISNPIRFKSRFNLFRKFQEHMAELGVQLIVVEQAFGDRPFVITERDNPFHVQLRTDQELWHKENMINIGIQHLCQIDPDWKYIAWVDGDIRFQRTDIILETAQQLQHYDIVQMFSAAIDLDAEQNPLQTHRGFMYQYFKNNNEPPEKHGEGGYYGAEKGIFWHPGYAWAARREMINRVPLFDKAILGAGDHHMALALIGAGDRSLPGNVSQAYKDSVMNWQEMADAQIRRNVGYVNGTITHYWHGSKKNRKYVERWKILTDLKYDPYRDIIRDAQGLYRINPVLGTKSIKLRDKIRSYLRQRQEDCIFLGNDEHF
jgi:hypothetical protein